MASRQIDHNMARMRFEAVSGLIVLVTGARRLCTGKTCGSDCRKSADNRYFGGRGRPGWQQRSYDGDFRYEPGLTALPLRSTSKCRCGPVERPVVPPAATP